MSMLVCTHYHTLNVYLTLNSSCTAPLPPPTNLMVTQSLATSITLTWDQPLGVEAVNRYEINYSFVVRECVRDNDNRPFQPVKVMSIDGSQRSYTIMNSSDTPVEEDSDYTISIRAVNSLGMSAQSNNATTTTASAGKYLTAYMQRKCS